MPIPTESTTSVVRINNHEITALEYRGQRVITLEMIDVLHERPAGTASRNFSRNRKRMIEREDFYLLDSQEAHHLCGYFSPSGMALLTESGYCMLVKSLRDDLAWQVQRKLVNGYFRMIEQAKPLVANPSSQAMIDLIVRYDDLEQRVKAGEERERARDKALIAQQAETIQALEQSARAEAKAEKALDDQYMTLEEFIVGQKLLHQFPRKTWPAAGKWLTDFCQQWNKQVIPKPVPWKNWECENAYPVQAIAAWLQDAMRKQGQIHMVHKKEEGTP